MGEKKVFNTADDCTLYYINMNFKYNSMPNFMEKLRTLLTFTHSMLGTVH